MCVRGRFNKLIKSARKHFHVFGAITKFKWKFVPSSRIFEYFIQRNQWKRKNDNWIEFNVKRIFRVVWWTKIWTFTNGTADKTSHRPQLTQINLATPQRPNKWKIILNSSLWMNLQSTMPSSNSDCFYWKGLINFHHRVLSIETDEKVF